MTLFAVFLIGGILILLFQQSKRQTQNRDQLLPALSPIKNRSKVKIPKWFGDIKNDGRVYFISFWASWCEPCKEELPYYEKLLKEFPADNFQIRLVNLDYGQEAIQDAKKMLATLGPNLTSAYENAKTNSSALNLQALPYHTLIDNQGRVAASFYAPLAKYKSTFRNRVQQLLDEKASP